MYEITERRGVDLGNHGNEWSLKTKHNKELHKSTIS